MPRIGEPDLLDDWDVSVSNLNPEAIFRAVEELYHARRCVMASPGEAYIYIERAIEALEHG